MVMANRSWVSRSKIHRQPARTCKESWRVWDFCPNCKLKVSLHSFMDAGRRHEMPGSETKNVVTYGTASSMSSTSALPPPPDPQVPQGQYWGTQVNVAHTVALCQNWWTPSLGELEYFITRSKEVCLIFTLEENIGPLPSAPQGVTLFSKAICYTNTLENITRNKW